MRLRKGELPSFLQYWFRTDWVLVVLINHKTYLAHCSLTSRKRGQHKCANCGYPDMVETESEWLVATLEITMTFLYRVDCDLICM